MITAGVDIGSTASKSIILNDGKILSAVIGPSTTNPKKTAIEVFDKATKDAGIMRDKIDYIVGTGYGRAKVDFADENISELSCHGRGAYFLLPTTRTIIDIGGQDTKVISIDERGGLLEFGMNDKCAAGTGRFLDFIGRSMNIEVTELSRFHAEATGSVVLSNMCSVFIESEVINLINDGVPVPNIVRGLHQSVASRVASQAKRVGVVPDVVITGGVAKNLGVVEELEGKLKLKLKRFPDNIDPQMIGAIGAAVLAKEKLKNK
jgi:(R)-2-hydroxyacyl-CoA dehydratese activating ATPase